MDCAAIDLHAPLIRSAAWSSASLELPLENRRSHLALCAQAGVPVILDPAPAAPLPDAVFHQTTWFTPNETEAAFYLATLQHPSKPRSSYWIKASKCRSQARRRRLLRSRPRQGRMDKAIPRPGRRYSGRRRTVSRRRICVALLEATTPGPQPATLRSRCHLRHRRGAQASIALPRRGRRLPRRTPNKKTRPPENKTHAACANVQTVSTKGGGKTGSAKKTPRLLPAWP